MKTKTQTQRTHEEMFLQLIQRNGNTAWHIRNNNDIVNSKTRSMGLNRATYFGIINKHSRGVYSIPEKSDPSKMAANLRELDKTIRASNLLKIKHQPVASIQFPQHSNSIAPTLEYCISRVKEAGYKVMKPTTEYKEI
jgi:lipid II:glycine glycyltransferase (peptidoglycan interpeptide bridge formation enzyme)